MIDFLLKQIGPSSTWICRIADLIDEKPDIPGFTYKSMGFPEDGFPRKLFPDAIKPYSEVVKNSAIDELEHKLDQFLFLKDKLNFKEVEAKDRIRLEAIADKLINHSCDFDDSIDRS